MSIKDANLQEKEVQVVKGVIFADEFRNRQTGKRIEESSEPFPDISNCARIHSFDEDTILTDEILSQVKSGDIVRMANMEFVVNNKVNQSPRSITGKMVGSITGDSITIYELDWVEGQALNPVSKKLDVSDEFDRDVTVQVATNGDSTFGTAISYEEWATKSKAKQYTAGTIIKMNEIFKGQSLRLIATDLTHGDGTEWQFYDMPVKYCQLGLPYDAQDFGDGGAAGLQGYLDGDDTYIYPSNMHGYMSATGLLDSLQQIFNGLPYKLKRDIRLTELDCYVKRICHSDDYGNIEDYSTGLYVQYEGESALNYTKQSQKLYCLSAAEMGYTGEDFPTTAEYDNGEETVNIAVEGVKHDYFETGNDGTALTKRIRYFGNETWNYWLRSSYLSGSGIWGIVGNYGDVNSNTADVYGGVAPAFRV